MSYVFWKIERQAYDEDTLTWEPTATAITEFSSPIVEVNSGDAKDSFSFTVTNFNGAYNNYFQPQDKVIVYRKVNSSTITSDDILLVGAIKDPPYNQTGSRNDYKIEGYNYSESVLSAVVARLDPAGKTIPQVIQTALNFVKADNDNFGITWHEDNPAVTQTGATFPAVYKQYANTTLGKIIEELSSDAFTGDGAYFYYVDINNKLVWKSTTGGAEYAFSTATDEFESIKSAKDVKGIINFIIIKGGRDPAGNPIQKRYRDYPSISKHGNKFYFSTDPGIQAETLNMQDMDKSDITKKGQHTQKTPYSYPFTCSWQAFATTTGDFPLTKGTAPTVADAPEYVQAIRAEITARMDALADALLTQYKNGKLKIDIGFAAGSKPWQLLDRIQCYIPEIVGTNIKLLRVREISYTSTTDVYSLVEDIGTI